MDMKINWVMDMMFSVVVFSVFLHTVHVNNSSAKVVAGMVPFSGHLTSRETA